MTAMIRLHRDAYEECLSDLQRPHPFAHERVGFFSSRVESLAGRDALVLLTRYWPISDDRYIRDPLVGARINADAIRDVMQRVMDGGDGAFHVHLHGDKVPLAFSRADVEGYRRLLPSLRAVGQTLAHGAIIFNSSSARSLIWHPDSEAPVPASKVVVVGFPIENLKVQS